MAVVCRTVVPRADVRISPELFGALVNPDNLSAAQQFRAGLTLISRFAVRMGVVPGQDTESMPYPFSGNARFNRILSKLVENIAPKRQTFILNLVHRHQNVYYGG
jgi:hypothetical protein